MYRNRATLVAFTDRIQQLKHSRSFFTVLSLCLYSFLLITNRYQQRCDELEVANGQFSEKFTQLETDKKEIVAFLKKNLEQRGTAARK